MDHTPEHYTPMDRNMEPGKCLSGGRFELPADPLTWHVCSCGERWATDELWVCPECQKSGCPSCGAVCGCAECVDYVHTGCMVVVGRDSKGREERWRRSCCGENAKALEQESDDLAAEAARMRELAGPAAMLEVLAGGAR